MFYLIWFFLILLQNSLLAQCEEINSWEIHCHVCRAVINEMETEIQKVNPNKIVEVDNFRINDLGNSVSKSIQYSKSETYLTELMEKICSSMEDYARVTNKETGELSIIKMLMDGKMNPDIGLYDFVQDGDLNKSLEHYCLKILEEYEDDILESFMNDNLNNDANKICSNTKYCRNMAQTNNLKHEL